ncbi:unnamed protein product [Caenorhabditis sp. 36 PRJEB53466]|nr:unnamed protein product [Caenorhabditis sp. 36 PRJEB53466]
MNCLLICLIVHKSPKALGAYRYLMIYISVFEIGYAFFDLSLRPEVATKGTHWLVTLDANLTFLPYPVLYISLLAWCGSFGIFLANFAVHFIFRYLAVIGEQKWTSSSGFRFWILMSSSAIYGFLWTLSVHIFEPRTDEMDEFIRTEMSSLKGVPIEEVVYVGFSFYEKISDTEEVINWNSAVGTLLLSLFIAISSTAMFYFATKCYLAIKELTDETIKSSKAKSLQAQLFFALVFQASIPMVLMHIPCSLVLLTTFFAKTEEFFGQVLTVSIALFPAIDPLPSMIIIKAYRNAIIGLCAGIYTRAE